MISKEIISDFLLFDLDGTLVDSTAAVEKTWIQQCKDHNTKSENFLDPEVLLISAHGSRTEDTIKKWFPYLPSDIESINMFEKGIVTNYGHLAKEVNGSRNLLNSINNLGRDQWAIVTSGTTDLAHGWFEKLFTNVHKPTVFITANNVSQGKPNPEGYLLAFSKLRDGMKLGGNEFSAIVFEDAPTGIKAGVAAEFDVIGVATTFSKEVLVKAGASYVIEDLSKIQISRDTTSFKLLLNII